ncbi:hypothetical protein T484DRAFT_3064192 [Baffinella frigidus]|nr:hypothetical protein T484DRAFT_3064192 [Cryptophyta sp. CCMP2293]
MIQCVTLYCVTLTSSQPCISPSDATAFGSERAARQGVSHSVLGEEIILETPDTPSRAELGEWIILGTPDAQEQAGCQVCEVCGCECPQQVSTVYRGTSLIRTPPPPRTLH